MKLSLILSALLLTASAQAGVQEFASLCKTPNLAGPIRVTVDSLVKLASGTFTSKFVTCDEAAKILNEKTEIDMPGHTFHYFFVEDLSPFSLLDNLRVLSIQGQDKVSDFRPLEKMKLESLDVGGIDMNEFTLQSIAQIETLRELTVSVEPGDAIWELLPLRLKRLNLHLTKSEQAKISQIDISPLKGLHLEVLQLGGIWGSDTGIQVIGLETHTNLRELYVFGTPMDGRVLSKLQLTKLSIVRSKLKNPDQLKTMTFLEDLNLDGLALKNIEFVALMKNLKSLSAPQNEITSLKPLENLVGLEHLDVQSNEIQFDFGLENLFRLKTLDISSNQISWTISLKVHRDLEKLNASGNKLGNLNLDEPLTKLKEIDLDGNEIRTVEFLSNKHFPALEVLHLNHNRIFKIDALGTLGALRELQLDDNRIQDISPLMGLHRLESLRARSNILTNPVCPIADAKACDFMHQGI